MEVMFDSNVFDKILSGEIPLEKIKKPTIIVYVTHIQLNEIDQIPEDKLTPEGRPKKAELINIIRTVGIGIPTEGFCVGVSSIGDAKIIDEKDIPIVEKIQKKTGNNSKDALIGLTCLKKNLILVTADLKLYKCISTLKGNAMLADKFIKML